jgi:hypothetical protein
VSATAVACPRCGTSLTRGQEYCLQCGLRQPGRWRVGPPPTETRDLRIRVAALAAVAVAGAAIAISVASKDSGAGLAQWSRAEEGWTIVLVSVPKTRGRDEAVAVAQQARSRGLPQVGVLDSSVFASLRPGYWMTFTGKYETEAEATSVLRKARAAVKGARVAQVSS